MSDQIQRLWDVYLTNPEEKNFVPFYEGTHRFVYSLCFHLLRNEEDAVDAFQSAYSRMVQHARVPEEDLSNEVAKQVLYRLTLREAQNLRARRRRRNLKEVSMEAPPDRQDHQPQPDKLAARHELREKMEVLLAQLPDKYRVPIFLHFFHEQTQEEIAQVIGMTQVTVSRRLAKGIKMLKPMMLRAGLNPTLLSGGLFAASITLLSPPSVLAAPIVYHNATIATVSAAASSGATATGIAGKWAASAKFLFSLKSLSLLSLAIVTTVATTQYATEPKQEKTTPIIETSATIQTQPDQEQQDGMIGNPPLENLDISLASLATGTKFRNVVKVENIFNGKWAALYTLTEQVEIVSRDQSGNTLIEHRIENIKQSLAFSKAAPMSGFPVANFKSLSFRYKINTNGRVYDLDILTGFPMDDNKMKLIIHRTANSYLRILPSSSVSPGDIWTNNYQTDDLDSIAIRVALKSRTTFHGLTQKGPVTLAKIQSQTSELYQGYGSPVAHYALDTKYLLDIDTKQLKYVETRWNRIIDESVKSNLGKAPEYRSLTQVSYLE